MFNPTTLQSSLAQRNLPRCIFARESGIAASAMSAIIQGYERIGPVRIRRMKLAMERLGFRAREIEAVFGKQKTEYAATRPLKTTSPQQVG